MSNFLGRFTINSTGTLNISSLGFNPNDLEFIVGPAGDSSSVDTKCLGSVDENGNQSAYMSYDNRTSNGPYAYAYTDDFCIWIQIHNGTTWVDALKASFNGFITGGFSLSVSVANSSYPVQVKARTT